jgi:hypothetical protein
MTSKIPIGVEIDNSGIYMRGPEGNIRLPVSRKYNYTASSYASLPNNDIVEANDHAKITSEEVSGSLNYIDSVWVWYYVEASSIEDLPTSNVAENAIGKVEEVYYRYIDSVWEEASGGGNGVPLGPVNGWSGLDALSPEVGSLAFVFNEAEQWYVYAIYSDPAGWSALLGWFYNYATLLSFNEQKSPNCLANVGTSDDASSTRYQWDAETELWVRTPEGAAYAWNSIGSLAALEDIDNPQGGDLAYVGNVDPPSIGPPGPPSPTSYGILRYDAGELEWQTLYGYYSGINRMLSSPAPKSSFALATVGESYDDPESVRYQWNGDAAEWRRTPYNINYVWEPRLTWEDVATIDNPLAGDRVSVGMLGLTGSSGVIEYDGTEWKVVQGSYANKDDMEDGGAYTASMSAIIGIPNFDITSTLYTRNPIGGAYVRMPGDVKYIYPSVLTWATLPAPSIIENNDEVHVQSLGTDHSSGTAQRHSGTWKLIEGKFQSVADMTAFDTANPVHTDAIGLVKAGGGHDEEAIAYSYQGGNWVRFGATTTAGYAWTITSLTQADPSGIGATQIGDCGVYTNPSTSETEVYVLNSSSTWERIGNTGAAVSYPVELSFSPESSITQVQSAATLNTFMDSWTFFPSVEV